MSARKPASVLLGPSLTKKGIRKVDEEINRDVRKFRRAAGEVVEERVSEIKEEKSGSSKSKDII